MQRALAFLVGHIELPTTKSLTVFMATVFLLFDVILGLSSNPTPPPTPIWRRYFQCQAKFGLFAPIHKVIRIGFPSTSPAKAKKSKRVAMGVSSLAHSPSSSSISSVSSVASSVGRPSRTGLVRETCAGALARWAPLRDQWRPFGPESWGRGEGGKEGGSWGSFGSTVSQRFSWSGDYTLCSKVFQLLSLRTYQDKEIHFSQLSFPIMSDWAVKYAIWILCTLTFARLCMYTFEYTYNNGKSEDLWNWFSLQIQIRESSIRHNGAWLEVDAVQRSFRRNAAWSTLLICETWVKYHSADTTVLLIWFVSGCVLSWRRHRRAMPARSRAPQRSRRRWKRSSNTSSSSWPRGTWSVLRSPRRPATYARWRKSWAHWKPSTCRCVPHRPVTSYAHHHSISYTQFFAGHEKPGRKGRGV